jgi:dihydrofolate reductase
MNKIIAVVAVGPDGLIGINNRMPWCVSEDLQRFKALTLNHTVIMGRHTWESLNMQCLPNRINYVLSKNGNFDLVSNSCITCFSDISYAISESNLKYPNNNVFIIGGANIYKQTLPIWDELYLSIINKNQVNYIEGKRIYLEDYPNIINKYFIEISSTKTEYATYKKYTRRVITTSFKNKLF